VFGGEESLTRRHKGTEVFGGTARLANENEID
jgi:hypothetical protein